MELTIHEINSKIYAVRGSKVMLDSDLALLYQVETKRLNEQVRRNIERFPLDFMFQVTDEELNVLRSQIATFNLNLKNTKYNPLVFTEQGIAMLSSVLKSKVAIDINIQVMRTFVEMRRYALTHQDLAKKIEELESRVSNGESVDKQILEVLNQLILEDTKEGGGKIGFVK